MLDFENILITNVLDSIKIKLEKKNEEYIVK